LPAALALAADPLASLVDTAFIGQIGILVLQFWKIIDRRFFDLRTETMCCSVSNAP
jgi:hypothetical protein